MHCRRLTIHSSRTRFVASFNCVVAALPFTAGSRVAGRLNSSVRPQMTIRDLLAKAQRNFIVMIVVTWLAFLLVSFWLPPRHTLFFICVFFVFIAAAFVYLYRSARCPRCDAKLWLSLRPVYSFGPKLNHCPSCGVSVNELADA